MGEINTAITGVRGYVPNHILDNEEPSQMVGINDEQITTRVGIKKHRILKEEDLRISHLVCEAVKQLIQETGVGSDTTDALIVAVATPDYKFLSTASIVLDKLGLKNALAHNPEAACCGFMYALSTACSLVESGRRKRVIVTEVDKMSSLADYQGRQTCVPFGDGAAAASVKASENGELDIQDMFFRIDGRGLPLLHVRAGDSVCSVSRFTTDRRLHYLYRGGRLVFRYAVTDMSNDVLEIAKRSGLSAGNMDWVVSHGANLCITEAAAKRAELPTDRVVINIQHYGNTSAATIPLTLWDYESKSKRDDNVIFTAFGVGFVHRASLSKWAYDGAGAVTRK